MYYDIYRDHLNDFDKIIDPTRSYSERWFTTPKKRSGKMHVPHDRFVNTIRRIFSEGGNYSDVARELMVSPSAVYSRVKKLKAQGDNSLPAIGSNGRSNAADAVDILSELGIKAEYKPVALESMTANTASEANQILRELGIG